MIDRVVGVLPDVPAIDKVFDYTVPPAMDGDVRVGTLVRIELHGRRVGGWVVREGGEAPPGRALRPIAKVTGWGPPPDVVELASWAAWRWAGRRSSLLGTASAPHAVRGLPSRTADDDRSLRPDETELHRLASEALGRPDTTVLRLAPALDPFTAVLAAVGRGPALVLHPSVDEAARLGRRLREAGASVAVHPREWAMARAGGVTVVGARAAAFAPMPDVGAVVVLDAHDESYQEERAPTWHARDVVVERARRAGAPCLLVSPCPDLTMTAELPGGVVVTDRSTERNGWPILDVID